MNQYFRISNRVQETNNKTLDFHSNAETVSGARSSSLGNRTLFAVLLLLGIGLLVGCVGPDTAPRPGCGVQTAACSSCSQSSDFRGQAPCQTCPTSTVSQCTGGIYRNTITVTCCNPALLWEAMVIPVRKYFTIYSEVPCQQIGCCVQQGTLTTNRTIGATIFEPWRGDSVGRQQRWESTLHTIARHAVINVAYQDHNQYSITVVVYKEIENTKPVNMSRNGQDNYFLSDSRRTFTDPFFNSENQSSDQWSYIGQDPLLEQRLLADIEQSIRARCRN